MTKTSNKSTEAPKKKVYFVPSVLSEVEATDLAELDKKVEKLKEQEDGDGDR